MSGLLTFGCGCQTRHLLAKHSQKLMLMKWRAVACGQIRAASSKKKRHIKPTHTPVKPTKDKPVKHTKEIHSAIPRHKPATNRIEPWKQLPKRESGTHSPIPRHKPATNRIEPGKQLPQRVSGTQLPQRVSGTQLPQRVSGTQLPQRVSGTQLPQRVSGTQLPQRVSGTQLPQRVSGTQLPQRVSGTQLPQRVSGTQLPQRVSGTQLPQRVSGTQLPQRVSGTQLPQRVSGTQLPQKATEEKNLFQQVVLAPKKTDDVDIGAELTGQGIEKDKLLKLLKDFYSQPKTQLLAAEHGIDFDIYKKSFNSFRLYCVESDQLPVEFHIILSDIIAGAGHVDDIFPFFLQHAHKVFPHLECIEELRHISDLTEPSHCSSLNRYPEARKLERKIIYHAGPTNSGKTYHALQRFFTGKSGVYCGPLRMLAVEVFNKCNKNTETPCDLVTGEDRRQASPDKPADHVACTVEMANLSQHYDVAIIDEIQMVRDSTRGWAWTKALLGLCADEIHVCGEGSAVDLVRELVEKCGDDLEVRNYDRLTKLTILDKGVDSFTAIRPGDCIVCFNKNDIYGVTTKLESLGMENAVIYGGLPPGTKYAQAEKFNDPDNSCNILVATDAIGMGLNLSIKRVIFYSLMKTTTTKDGSKQVEKISTSQALQIAGRAGRFGTQYEDGEVTTFKSADLPMLKVILGGNVEPITQFGLHPTAEQIELFAYHLPKATLANLIDIFMHLCRLDHDKYFMCNMEDFKYLSDIIEHIPLALKVRYTLCSAPISSQDTYTCNMFIKFARQMGTGRPITYDWLMEKMKAPFQPPKTLQDLVHLEQAFDVFDLYLWLGYRFPAMFPDMELVREAQVELDYVIQESVAAITNLLNQRKPAKVKKSVTISTEKIYGRQPNKPKSATLHATATSDGNVNTSAVERLETPVIEAIATPEETPKGNTPSPNEVLADLLSFEANAFESKGGTHATVNTPVAGATHIRNNKTTLKNEVIGINDLLSEYINDEENGDHRDAEPSNSSFLDIDNLYGRSKIDIDNLHGQSKGENTTQAVEKVHPKTKALHQAFEKVHLTPKRPQKPGRPKAEIRKTFKTLFQSAQPTDQRTNDSTYGPNAQPSRKKNVMKANGKETLRTLSQSIQSVTERNSGLTNSPNAPLPRSLMRSLIKKGLLTDEMMVQLHKEWKEAQEHGEVLSEQGEVPTESLKDNQRMNSLSNSMSDTQGEVPSESTALKDNQRMNSTSNSISDSLGASGKNSDSGHTVIEKPIERNQSLANAETETMNDNNNAESKQMSSSGGVNSDEVSINDVESRNNNTNAQQTNSSDSDNKGSTLAKFFQSFKIGK